MVEENYLIQGMEAEPTSMEIWETRSALNREYAPKPDMQVEWARLQEKIRGENIRGEKSEVRSLENSDMSKEYSLTSHLSPLTSFLLGIAATVAAFFLFNLFTKEQVEKDDYFFTADNGQQEVTITTDNGQPAVVRDRTLSFATSTPPNVQGSKSQAQSTKLLTLSTPRGMDYQVTLADGTKVWMNADSKLEFPETFAGETREVTLHGEAYFEVAKDAAHPFIVKTDYFQTRVLGTSFNIRAYSDRNANVVLIDGSVALEKKEDAVTLIPGQQAQFNTHSSKFKVVEVDTYPYIQWRDGFFYFENQTLFEIMQELGRWYNVNIAFDDPDKMNLRLHFVASRNQSIEEAVKNMNALGVVDVEYNGDAVIVR